jgi:hypothetical protein
MKQQPHLGFIRHLHRKRLERLGIDGRRPCDDAVVGRGPLRPIGGGGGVATAPVGAWRAGDCAFRQPINKFLGKTADNVPAGPIGHTVDPNNKTAGRKPAEMIVSLDQQHIGAQPRRGNGGGRSGRTAADHQDVGFGEHRHFALRLDNRFRRTRALGAAAALEKFDTDRRANAAREVAASWRPAKNLALSNLTSGGRCVFFAAHRMGLTATSHARKPGRTQALDQDML